MDKDNPLYQLAKEALAWPRANGYVIPTTSIRDYPRGAEAWKHKRCGGTYVVVARWTMGVSLATGVRAWRVWIRCDKCGHESHFGVDDSCEYCGDPAIVRRDGEHLCYRCAGWELDEPREEA